MVRVGVQPLAADFRAGRDNPEAALERCLRAADLGRADRALLALIPEARRDAEAAARRFRAGEPLGPLDGIPVVVKDCIDVAGLPTTNGTRFLTTPVREDALLVRRLRAAGAVLFAKANMHEFGIQPTGINPHYGTPVNPWAPERIPGGSSSGAAVAVASGIAPLAIGTDAGGSIRVPAVFNGLVGLKPTFGAVPDQGVARLTHDLDHAGPIAWTVEDASIAFEVLSGQTLGRTPEGSRIGVLTDWFGGDEGTDAAVRTAVEEVFGAGLPEVPTPVCRWASQLEFVTVAIQSVDLVGTLLRDHASQMGADARTILQMGQGIPEVYRRRAIAGRQKLREELAEALTRFDLLLAPGCGAPAPLIHPGATAHGELDTAQMARFAGVTFPANLAGLPSCVVPCSRAGIPVGLQIVGRPGEEGRVLAAARQVERMFGPRLPPRWHGAAPRL